jgi:hypothetical protein
MGVLFAEIDYESPERITEGIELELVYYEELRKFGNMGGPVLPDAFSSDLGLSLSLPWLRFIF